MRMAIIVLSMFVISSDNFFSLFSFSDGDNSRTLRHDQIRIRREHFDDSETSEEVSESVESSTDETEETSDDENDPSNVYLAQLKILNDFAGTLLKNYEYFLFGEDTSQCEAFHFVCNCHYVKGIACSFAQYKMRKTHAAFHWIESQQDKYDNVPLSFPQRWELELIAEFKLAISKSYSPNAEKSLRSKLRNNTNS